jgi:hypothetical protein
MFGSQYRVEVAAAIMKLGEVWTTLELEDELPERKSLPWSCVAKELTALLEIGVIEKPSRPSINGRIPYSRSKQFPEFWDLIVGMSASQEGSTPLRVLPYPVPKSGR